MQQTLLSPINYKVGIIDLFIIISVDSESELCQMYWQICQFFSFRKMGEKPNVLTFDKFLFFSF